MQARRKCALYGIDEEGILEAARKLARPRSRHCGKLRNSARHARPLAVGLNRGAATMLRDKRSPPAESTVTWLPARPFAVRNRFGGRRTSPTCPPNVLAGQEERRPPKSAWRWKSSARWSVRLFGRRALLHQLILHRQIDEVIHSARREYTAGRSCIGQADESGLGLQVVAGDADPRRPMLGFKSIRSARRYWRSHDELRNFLRCRSRMNQRVSASTQRFHHMRRTATALRILEAA